MLEKYLQLIHDAAQGKESDERAPVLKSVIKPGEYRRFLILEEFYERQRLERIEKQFLHAQNDLMRLRLERQRIKHAEVNHELISFTRGCACDVCTGKILKPIVSLKNRARVAEEFGDFARARSLRARALNAQADFILENFGAFLNPITEKILSNVPISLVGLKQ